jgi:hypothetical protein
MTDPRDFDTRAEMDRRLNDEARMSSPTPWGWIAACAFIVFLLALVFTSGDNTRTARNDANPPATTGMGMAPPPAPPAGAPATSGSAR